MTWSIAQCLQQLSFLSIDRLDYRQSSAKMVAVYCVSRWPLPMTDEPYRSQIGRAQRRRSVLWTTRVIVIWMTVWSGGPTRRRRSSDISVGGHGDEVRGHCERWIEMLKKDEFRTSWRRRRWNSLVYRPCCYSVGTSIVLLFWWTLHGVIRFCASTRPDWPA